MFLKDLADKTRRGLRGRVEKDKSGGGLAYGYKVAQKINSEGEALKGDREIIEEQANIIRRIFEDYAYKNKSPKYRVRMDKTRCASFANYSSRFMGCC